MAFTTDSLSYKAYAFTTNQTPIELHDFTLKLEKQLDGSYNVPTDKVLVKVHAVALNPVDLKLYNAAIWPVKYLVGKHGLGLDYSGKIVAIGEKAQLSTAFRVGDLIQGITFSTIPTGALSQYLLVDPANAAVGEFTHIPNNLSLTDASSWPTVYGTVHKMTSGLDLNQKKVLIIGGGTSVGRYLIQYVKLEGAKQIFATASPRSEAIVKQLGADDIIDYTKGSILNPTLELVKSGEPFDYIFDCAGNNELFPKIEYILPKSGKGVYVTIVGDAEVHDLNLSSLLVIFNSLKRILWSNLNQLPYTYKLTMGNTHYGWIERGKQLIEEGKLKPFIDSYYKFSDLDKALELLEKGKLSGKIIIKVEEDEE